MKQMVDDFREYARTPPAVLQPLQLDELIEEVLALYEAQESFCKISLDLSPLPGILGDPTQLRQLIHNLLQNAQDAVAQTETPIVQIEAKPVEYESMNEQNIKRLAVRLTVSDNGPGLSPHLLTRAFEPYVTTKARGTGLGLAIVKKIVDEHGARIDLRNRSSDDDTDGGGQMHGAQISILFTQLADAQTKVMS
jgi:nitrogen fixation/metabolism regulation signal transduction histidine kinase